MPMTLRLLTQLCGTPYAAAFVPTPQTDGTGGESQCLTERIGAIGLCAGQALISDAGGLIYEAFDPKHPGEQDSHRNPGIERKAAEGEGDHHAGTAYYPLRQPASFAMPPGIVQRLRHKSIRDQTSQW